MFCSVDINFSYLMNLYVYTHRFGAALIFGQKNPLLAVGNRQIRDLKLITVLNPDLALKSSATNMVIKRIFRFVF